MLKFNKRLFGQAVSVEIRERFRRLAGGMPFIQGMFDTPDMDDFGEMLAEITENTVGGKDGLLKEQKPTFEKYLGERTSFSRMWCAVNTIEIDKETGDPKEETSKIKVFKVNENTIDSYSPGSLDVKSPFDEIQPVDTGKIESVSQLRKNSLLRPAAGITSVTSKTQGSLGAIQNTTVEFVVHNKHDFDNIFLPFFLKPGSIVCVDYGWSDQNLHLYDPLTFLQNEDTEMSVFDEAIYGEGGYLEDPMHFGLVNTVMGNVVSYEANLNTEGSFQCSIEIISRNAGLLDKEISDDNNLKVMFTNAFDDILINAIAADSGVKIERSKLEWEETFSDIAAVDDEIINERYQNLKNDYLKNEGITYDETATNFITEKASRIGIFYSEYSTLTRATPNENGEGNEAYISLGKFEDLFLNSFVSGLVKKDDAPTPPSMPDNLTNNFKKSAKNNFDNVYDSRSYYIRWDSDIHRLQSAKINKGNKQPSFVVPNQWYNSYNSIETGRSSGPKVLDEMNFVGPKKEITEAEKSFSKVDSSKELQEKEKNGEFPGYEGIPVMPIRDLFVSVAIITEAFKTKSTINDALLFICDKINEDSHKIFNMKIVSQNDSKANLSFIDANLLPTVPKEERLIFNILGETSIVSKCDLKFTTPKAGLASMIAISNLTEPTEFDQIELSSLNNLNLLNRPEGDKNFLVRSLPFQGDVNPLIFDEEVGIDFNQIEAKVKNKSESTSEPVTNSSNRYKKYIDGVNALRKDVVSINEIMVDDPNLSGIGPTPDQDFSHTGKQYSDKAKGGESIVMVKSTKDALQKKVRNKLYNKKGAGNVSPILPVELDLSLYGNKYLQIGDCYSVNYLPSHFKDRTFFQIVGIEDNITVGGWTTSYTSVMRIDPDTDRFMSFRKGKDPETIAKDENIIVISKKEKEPEIAESIEESLELDITDTYVPPKTKKRIKKAYIDRLNGSILLDGGSHLAQFGADGVEKANNSDITYKWFVGTQFEEVVVEKNLVLYRRIVTLPDFSKEVKLIVKHDHDLSRPAHKQDVEGPYDDQFIKKTITKKGYEIAGNDNHPGIKKYRKVLGECRIDSKMKFKTELAYFDAPTENEKFEFPESMYHPFNINEKKFDSVDNLAMMYAIRNGILENMNTTKVFTNEEWPPKKKSDNRYEDSDIIICYYDALEMLSKHSITYKRGIDLTFGLDEREEALAKVIAKVVKPLDNIPDRAFGPGATIPYTPLGDNFRLPRPITTILFKDEGIQSDRDDDDKVIINTGSEIFFLTIADDDPEYMKGIKDGKITDIMKIPKHLLKREDGTPVGHKDVLNRINELYSLYKRAFSSAISEIKQREPAPLPTITALPR